MVDKTVEKPEPPLKERVASRKFLLAITLQVFWIALFIVGKLSEPGFISLTEGTVLVYMIANVGEKYTGRK